MIISFSGDYELFRYKHEIQERMVWLIPAPFSKIEKQITSACKEHDAVLVLRLVDCENEQDTIMFLERVKAIVLHHNLLNKVRFAYYQDEEEYFVWKFFNEWEEVKWFYMDKVTSLDKMTEFKNKGVSDIYLCGEICFDLEKLAPVLHEAGIRIRVCPNYAQMNGNINPTLAFWIRPEDIDLYAQYVDVFELVPTASQNFSILHKIFFQDKKWFGPYSEIIAGYDGTLNGQTTIPMFGEYRVGCGKRCLRGGHCQMCFTSEKLSKSLYDKGIYISEEE